MSNVIQSTANPLLNQIAKQLMTAQWQYDLSSDEQLVCDRLQQHPDAARHLVTLLRDYKTWAIRMYLAGCQRTFGFWRTSPENPSLAPALRYADMIRMYFWKYKRRDAYEPTDNNLNISAERANLDLVHETDVVRIIQEIEQHFREIRVILPPEEQERQLKNKVARQRAKPTLKLAVVEAAEVQRLALSGLRSELGGLRSDVSSLRREIKDLVACVNTLPAFRPVEGPIHPPAESSCVLSPDSVKSSQ